MLEVNDYKVDKYTIHLTRGDTAFLQVIPLIEEEVEEENPSPIPKPKKKKELKPYELKDGDIVVFRLASNSRLLVEKLCTINVPDNLAVLTLMPYDTVDLVPQVYSYEFELVTNEGAHFTFIENQRFEIGKELEKHD